VYTGVGGKYTTHRVFAEDFYKEIYGSKLKYDSLKSKSFPGAWSVSREQTAHALARFEFVDNLIMDRWLDIYGQRSLELANFIQAKPENKEFISSTYGLMKGEVKYCIEREWARLPVDFLRRRTGLYYTESGGFDVYQEVKEVFNKLVPHMNSLEDECTYTQYLQNFCHRAVDAE
jgi:glycerol-3-phosphate dehydrogenase